MLPIAPSTYYLHAAWRANPALRSTRAKQDKELIIDKRLAWKENFEVYGTRQIWLQLRCEGKHVARCTVERLMHKLGLRGVVRGKRVKMTVTRSDDVYPLDRVKRQFTAIRPNTLCGADFTYVSTWQVFVYVAFVLDALEQALSARRPTGGLIH